jgi:ABC-type polysaccharide/polyol phosphate transport system ATPase subunit
MNQKMEGIIEFSGIEYFIDSPLRTYSSGMVTRLAFALATDVDSDVVLIDEVLAVGDQTFREKCIQRIERIKGNGTTFVVVSHNSEMIKKLCSRVIWLEHGKIIGDGNPEQILKQYQGLTNQDLFEASQVDHP